MDCRQPFLFESEKKTAKCAEHIRKVRKETYIRIIFANFCDSSAFFAVKNDFVYSSLTFKAAY